MDNRHIVWHTDRPMVYAFDCDDPDVDRYDSVVVSNTPACTAVTTFNNATFLLGSEGQGMVTAYYTSKKN